MTELKVKKIILQPKFASKALWLAVLTNVAMICQISGLFELWGIDAGNVQDIIVLTVNTASSLFAAWNTPIYKNAG